MSVLHNHNVLHVLLHINCKLLDNVVVMMDTISQLDQLTLHLRDTYNNVSNAHNTVLYVVQLPHVQPVMPNLN
jgi:hypothetical protein